MRLSSHGAGRLAIVVVCAVGCSKGSSSQLARDGAVMRTGPGDSGDAAGTQGTGPSTITTETASPDRLNDKGTVRARPLMPAVDVLHACSASLIGAYAL